jgi:hypothetical protein
MDKDTAYKILKDKVYLLSRGIIIHPRKWWMPVRHKQSYAGGPGPQGRIYYLSYAEDGPAVAMISIPAYPKDHYLAKYAVDTKRSKTNPHNLITESGIFLRGRPSSPSFRMSLKDGTSIGRNVLFRMHCYDTYAISPSLACYHHENGTQCRYCTIDIPTSRGWGLPKRFSDEHLVEALQVTLKHSRVRSITMTGGTFPDPDSCVRGMIGLIKKIRAVADISVHAQFEPVSDPGLLKELSSVADSAGIFLEIFDEDIRKAVCPGKSKIPKEKYIAAWKEAVQLFGRGNVLTTCILGFSEDLEAVLREVETPVSLGVRVGVLLVRPGSRALGRNFIPSYIGKENEIVDFYIRVAQLLFKYNLDTRVGDASGCIGCFGCSAVMEACEYLRSS